MPYLQNKGSYPHRLLLLKLSALAAFGIGPQLVSAQQEPAPPTKAPVIVEIPENPQFQDEAQFLPKGLAKSVSVNFDKSTLEQVVAWLSENQDMPVVLQLKMELNEGLDIDPSEVLVSDQLRDQPIFWLLNRLKSVGVYWFVEDELLHLTTASTAEAKLQTQSYTLSDLLDAGFSKQKVEETLEACVNRDGWVQAGGTASLQWLGDVLFVRQNYAGQLQVATILAALKDHGRRTWINESLLDQAVRKQLSMPVSVALKQQPLSKAVQSLSEVSGIDIRLDQASLSLSKIRDKSPVTINVANRSVSSALDLLVLELNAAWIYENGVVRIVSQDAANAQSKVAVMDVRDLCRDAGESAALERAIESQADGEWESQGGNGTIRFPRNGTMAVAGTERTIADVERLLFSYRKALLTSKPRGDSSENELVQEFYVVQSDLAKSLVELLPILVEPASWKTDSRPDAIGSILVYETEPTLIKYSTNFMGPKGTENQDANQPVFLSMQTAVIITQKRSTHEKIIKLIEQLKGNKNSYNSSKHGGLVPNGGMGGGMGGMGGFGGGMM